MGYLLPAGMPARTKNKWGLGILAERAMMPNGGGGGVPRSNIVLFRPPSLPPTPRPILPGPMPVWPGPGGGSVGPVGVTQRCYPGDVMMANATWDPVGCRWVPNEAPPNAPAAASTAGTPVPAGFPVNQFFVASDGSVWEYSTSGNQWVNTGTPYNTGASSSGGATSPTPAAITDSSASAPPVSVTVTTPPTSSGYQAILDWLTQSTLISPVPNWVVAAAAALIASKVMGSSSGGKR